MPQIAPARNPAPNMAGSRRGGGKSVNRATPAAATAPARSCPSAPMFQNLERNASTRPTPHRSKGMVRRSTSISPNLVPSVPLMITA
jgi:hypothetical protein